MHIDARELPQNSVIEGDICIIGAGIAGISMALDRLDTPFKVILLEGGGFEYDEKVQELYQGKVTGQNYYPLKATRLYKFGGTSDLWAGACSTFDDLDFKERNWVPDSGWPISKVDLEDYYKRAHEILELGPYEYELDFWIKKNPAYQILPFNADIIWNKIWHFSPPTRFAKKYKNAIEASQNIHLYTYANVVDLKSDENIRTITEVTASNYAGKDHAVKARYFILACGAIQNASLLLASNKQAKKGIGNQNDLVGRYFMEHLEMPSAQLWLSKKMSMDLYFKNDITHISSELGISEKVQTNEKILNGTVSLAPLANFKLGRSKLDQLTIDKAENDGDFEIKDIWSRISRKTKKLGISQIDHIENAYQCFIRMEQAPNSNSKIYLDSEKDSLGVPYANLHWEFTDLEKKSLRRIIEIIGIQVGISNIGRVKLDEYLKNKAKKATDKFSGGFHHMGTTRMSDNPETGVVDRNCKVHGLHNLFIAGSSCFPTAGAPNPTLTLVALSLRLSDYIKKDMI